jgi:hypothetical protein
MLRTYGIPERSAQQQKHRKIFHFLIVLQQSSVLRDFRLPLLGFLTLEEETDRFFRNVGKELPPYTA